MSVLQTPWSYVAMNSQREDDLEAVLRTLKLAQAQLRTMQRGCASDPERESEFDDAVVAIDLLLKKLNVLLR